MLALTSSPRSSGFFKEHKGVATVEFALVMIPFFMLVLFTMELSRVIYLYATIDLSLSEASQRSAYSGSRDTSTDYVQAFKAAFKDNVQKAPLLTDSDTADITIQYCTDIEQIINDGCSSDAASRNRPLAVYSVVYHYEPVFFIFPEKMVKKSLTRNLVYVQEYERAL